MKYYFDEDVAKDVGVEEAIMFSNILYWVQKNKANKQEETHYHDGKWWTYNTIDAFVELFPFWSKRQIERILKNLVENDYIYKDSFNKNPYDRTTWYAVNFAKLSSNANREVEIRKTQTRNAETVKSSIDTNNKPNNKPIAPSDDDAESKPVKMNVEQFVKWCEKSPHRHIEIIGGWASMEEPDLRTKAQWKEYLKRYLRAAKRLVPYDDDQIYSAYKEMKEKDWMDKPTLETIYKFINK